MSAATHAALSGYSEALRQRAARDGVRVTLVETEGVAQSPADLQPLGNKQESPWEKPGPEDVAHAIHYSLTQPQRCVVAHIHIRQAHAR